MPRRPAGPWSRPAPGRSRCCISCRSGSCRSSTLALLITGLAVRGVVGAVALCLMAALLGWLAFVSWPGLSSRGRAGRALVIACVLVAAGVQASR